MENTNTGPPQRVAPWRWALIGLILIAAVGVGYAGGKKAQDEAVTARYGFTVPRPAVTVTPEPHTVIEVEEVEVPIQACLDALDWMDAIFAEVILPLSDLMGEAVIAAEDRDYALAAQVSAEMDALQPLAAEFVAEYNVAAEECRNYPVRGTT